MSGLGKRIREMREARGITQEALGRACGVTRSAVALWETKDGTAPTADKIEPIANLLEVEGEWLLTGKHSRAHRQADAGNEVRVPEYDVRVSAGGGFYIEKETKRGEWPFARHYIENELRLSPSQLVVLEVVGDSMEPTLKGGDRVLVNMNDKRVSQPGMFVLWDGDGTVVKRLEIVPNTKPLKILRISDNPLHRTYEVLATDTMIVGRVVWYARRI